MADGADMAGMAPAEPEEQGAPGGAPGGAPPAPGGPPGGPPPSEGGALPFLRKAAQPSAPGPGDQAQSMMMIKNGLAMIQSALPGLDQGSPLHQDVLKLLQRIGRHMAQGNPTIGAQATQMGDMARNLLRNALLSRLTQNQQAAGGQGQQPGGPPPMPSLPLPGA